MYSWVFSLSWYSLTGVSFFGSTRMGLVLCTQTNGKITSNQSLRYMIALVQFILFSVIHISRDLEVFKFLIMLFDYLSYKLK